ncbi:fumarate/nitrate reduction transcriptional regulator Fnr [Zophobihabitans entericus]|uniref:Fumarate/nitrate reduction transcriptional regulator Fnr n=1 Tax=Zophobihabitans entericus TaxID=1635327 RepID=A0A6G9ICY0_9GAMM|nr:fumarate/nitrate reduction transcriptional regulator Fnr [Zophobihabitans entericus]QIQ22091.1 fumarate/nitrate reduction transcriptional regulator Fnr [Zophobihabitans entericus]
MHNNSYKRLRSNSYSVPCELCSIGSLCIPMIQDCTLGNLLNQKKALAKNEIAVKAGDPFNKLYVIHSGCLKSYVITNNGTQQITGFYLPGDILGYEAICENKYHNYIEALTHTLVCEVKYDRLIAFGNESASIREHNIRLMSNEILNQQRLIMIFAQKNAEERLATFVYSMYRRYAQRGHTSLNIKLAMSRADIANHLGLTIETVSRIFTRLQQAEILMVKGKYILIKNLSELIKAAGESE